MKKFTVVTGTGSDVFITAAEFQVHVDVLFFLDRDGDNIAAFPKHHWSRVIEN